MLKNWKFRLLTAKAGVLPPSYLLQGRNSTVVGIKNAVPSTDWRAKQHQMLLPASLMPHHLNHPDK